MVIGIVFTPAISGVMVSLLTMMWKLPLNSLVLPGPVRCQIGPADWPGISMAKFCRMALSASMRSAGFGPCWVSSVIRESFILPSSAVESVVIWKVLPGIPRSPSMGAGGVRSISYSSGISGSLGAS